MSYDEPIEACIGLRSAERLDAPADDTLCETQARRAAPQIRYVDEAEVASMVRCDELGSETCFAAELGAARNGEERMRLVRSALRVLGFLNLAYVTVQTDRHGNIDRAYVLRNELSPELIRRMLLAGFVERSPRFRAALAGDPPQSWDLRSLMASGGKKQFVEEDRQLIDAMREEGFCSGLVFGLPISDTPLRSIVILASPREAAADWLTEGILVQSLTLGLSLHQRCAAYARAAQRREALGSLSPLHRQIVGWLALGLSDKEIAIRLDMTAYNIDYHLRQLKERYGALNRSHLAFIAGSL